MTAAPHNKQDIARAFGAAVASYDQVAVLQRETADELLDRLDFYALQPSTILDLGCGTGRNLWPLLQRYPQGRVIGLDIAQPMLDAAKQKLNQQMGWRRFWPHAQRWRLLHGDAEALPLPDQSVEMVFANLTLQWCDLSTAMREMRRVLKPNGLLLFSTLGPDTLQELRQAWASVDDMPHINQFMDLPAIGQTLMQAGLQDVVLDRDVRQLFYPSALPMMRDLHLLGARNVHPARRRGLTGKQRFQAVMRHCEHFRQAAGIPATYEVVYGQAFAPSTSDSPPKQPASEVRIPIEELLRR